MGLLAQIHFAPTVIEVTKHLVELATIIVTKCTVSTTDFFFRSRIDLRLSQSGRELSRGESVSEDSPRKWCNFAQWGGYVPWTCAAVGHTVHYWTEMVKSKWDLLRGEVRYPKQGYLPCSSISGTTGEVSLCMRFLSCGRGHRSHSEGRRSGRPWGERTWHDTSSWRNLALLIFATLSLSWNDDNFNCIKLFWL